MLPPFRNIVFLLSLILLATAGCSSSSRRTAATLDDVESYVNDRPDSALAVLRSMDAAALRRPSLRARHALLHTMALDKNYVDLQTDSIIAPAVAWYGRHGSPDEKLKTLYYLGRLQYNAKDYQQAIVTYTEALGLTDKARDPKYIGFVNQAIADTYSVTYQEKEALPYLDRAYESFLQIPDSSLAKRTLYKKALCLADQRKWDQAMTMYQNLLANPFGIEDLVSRIKCAYGLLLIQYDDQRTNEASMLFHECLSDAGTLYSVNNWAAYALCLSREGKPKQSESILGQLEQLYPDDKRVDYWRSKIERENGDYPKAYSLYRSSMEYQDSLLRIQLEHSTMLAQKSYFEKRAIAEEQSARKRGEMLWISCSVFVLLILLSCMYLRYRTRRAQHEQARLQKTIDMVSRIAENMSSEKEALQQQYNALFQDYYNMLGKICADYEEGKLDKTNASDRAVLRRLDRIISDFSGNTDNRQAFEKILNRHLNNIMADFRRDYPKMKQQRYTLAGYIFAGIEMPIISVLMGIDMDVLYSRKYRMKNEISSSDVLNKDKYLEYFR